MIRYTLPLPPSTNKLYVNLSGGRRRKSDAYKAWLGLAGASLAVQRAAHLKALQPAAIHSGPWQIELRPGRPDARKRDIDNLVKATLDLLVRMQLAPDDSECMRITLEWADHDRPEAEVCLRPYHGGPDPAHACNPTWDEVEALVREIGSDYGFFRSPEAQGAMEAVENLLGAIKERRGNATEV